MTEVLTVVDLEELPEPAIWIFPDGATSWIGGFEVAEWELKVEMYAFTAHGENEAHWFLHEFFKRNAEALKAMGPGELSLIVPSQPKWTPRGEANTRVNVRFNGRDL